MSKILSDQWAQMSDEDRAPYTVIANQQMEEYKTKVHTRTHTHTRTCWCHAWFTTVPLRGAAAVQRPDAHQIHMLKRTLMFAVPPSLVYITLEREGERGRERERCARVWGVCVSSLADDVSFLYALTHLVCLPYSRFSPSLSLARALSLSLSLSLCMCVWLWCVLRSMPYTNRRTSKP